MSSVQKQIGLAAVLAQIVTENGRIQGRVRLQKLCYLLQQLKVPELEGIWFRYQDYGPFSDDIAGVLQQAIFTNIIEEKTETFEDEWQHYEYKPGSKAQAYLDQLAENSRLCIRRLVDAARDAHWRVLELAATVDYLEKQEHLDRSRATTRALALKPACASYEKQALHFLGSIRDLPSVN